MTYEVTDIHIVKPKEAYDYLSINEGKDLVTLVTCYPYAVNSHRLLVTGERVNISTANVLQETTVNNNADFWRIIFIIGEIIAAVLLIVFFKILRKKKNKCPSEGQKE